MSKERRETFEWKKRLAPNEVFVFGSNLKGFHGAGSAGYASFGVSGNQWRRFEYDTKPHGWKGLWNVKGISEGIQYGTSGASYAIPTVAWPGRLRSIPLSVIKESIAKFYRYAKDNADRKFYVAYGFASTNCGYSLDELAQCFAIEEPPHNVIFTQTLTDKLYENNTFKHI